MAAVSPHASTWHRCLRDNLCDGCYWVIPVQPSSLQPRFCRSQEGKKLSEQLYGMFFGGEYPPLHQATSQHIRVWSVCPVHHQAGNPGAAQISPPAPSEPLQEGGASWLWPRLANRSEKLKKKRLEEYKLEECEKKWRKCISQIVSRP